MGIANFEAHEGRAVYDTAKLAAASLFDNIRANSDTLKNALWSCYKFELFCEVNRT